MGLQCIVEHEASGPGRMYITEVAEQFGDHGICHRRTQCPRARVGMWWTLMGVQGSKNLGDICMFWTFCSQFFSVLSEIKLCPMSSRGWTLQPRAGAKILWNLMALQV